LIKVIETNLSIDAGNNIKDYQSRIIEIDDWEEFVNEIKEAKTVIRNSCLGNLHGTTIPRNARVENLSYDDSHLMCDIYNFAGIHSKKLVYKVY
jgi:hypothetical protein